MLKKWANPFATYQVPHLPEAKKADFPAGNED